MRKRQYIRNRLERAAYHCGIEPDIREPCAEVSEQSSANASDSLLVQHGTKQQTERDKHERNRNINNYGNEKVYTEFKSEYQSARVAYSRL